MSLKAKNLEAFMTIGENMNLITKAELVPIIAESTARAARATNARLQAQESSCFHTPYAIYP
jgi:hypothetical protein